MSQVAYPQRRENNGGKRLLKMVALCGVIHCAFGKAFREIEECDGEQIIIGKAMVESASKATSQVGGAAEMLGGTGITLDNVKLASHQLSGPHNDQDASYAAVVENDILHLEQEFAVSKFKDGFKKPDLNAEFSLIDQLTYLKQHKARFNKDPAVDHLNRYTDILPFNDTRVILKSRDGMPTVDTYINANFVNSALGNDKKLICAQGPKSNTVDHFWRMVSEQNVTLIVSVCRLEEGGRPKCHKYWPETSSDPALNKLLVTPGLSVKMVSARSLGSTLQERTFQVTLDGQTMTTKQLNYVGWPDHGVPTGASIDDFQLMLNELIHMILNSDPTAKAIIHCSAGIGRTGTTASLSSLLINVASQLNQGIADPKISVFSTVRRLREQRFSMVQMPEQYVFIYQFLQYWLKQKKLIQ